jgi:glycosyltransferase involved in cell wall biosynthesis
MRVLALTTEAYGGYGGIAQYNQDFFASLVVLPQVDSVDVVVRHAPQSVMCSLPGLTQYCLRGGRLGYVLGALLAARRPPDLVVCGHLNLLSVAVALRRWGRWRGHPTQLLSLIYGIEAWTPRRRRGVHDIDRLASISRTTLERFSAWSDFPADRTRLLPCAVNLERFTPGPPDPALAVRLGIHGRPVIAGLGRLDSRERYKGFDEMIAVLPALLSRYPDLVYAVAGEGDDRARLMALAESRGVGRHVIFPGRIAEDEKAGFLCLADVFVLAGRGEGFGIVLLEAMACGVPVVASTLDGSREAVADGRLGELVDPGDEIALVAAVERALAKGRGRPHGLDDFGLPMFGRRVAETIFPAARPGKPSMK